MNRPLVIDPARCPACGNTNDCALASGNPIHDCWCWQAPPSGLPAAGARQCLCASCLTAQRPAREASHAR